MMTVIVAHVAAKTMNLMNNSMRMKNEIFSGDHTLLSANSDFHQW